MEKQDIDNGNRILRVPITDSIDLHTFRPKEVADLLEDYFAECLEKGIAEVRVIHGKGSGALKKRVQSILKKNTMVRSYQVAPPEFGGWGATVVYLEKKAAER